MTIENGIVPAVCIAISFILGILLGYTEAHRRTKTDVLVEICEASKGSYDFCKKKTQVKDYYEVIWRIK